MKKSYLFATLAIVTLGSIFIFSSKSDNQLQDALLSEVKTKHRAYINNSPFKESQKLSKQERKNLGIPPNKYLEREWELTMNPNLGRPTPKKLQEIQKQLAETRALSRVPGDAVDNMWVERGPNDVGGRTRAIMFDPNDPTHKTVFAGGVSGGLWKNTDITSNNTSWTKVNLPENVNVSCITYDPNDTNIFYLGTGEAYVGDISGNGVWKSTDGGTTWSQIFGGISGAVVFTSANSTTINSPASVAGSYASYPTTAFGPALNSTITADLVLANDDTAPTTDGCTISTVSMTGKIALIRRGSCNFTVKVKNAQNAGAIGVIMMNNNPGTPIPMGGTDATITIPSVMISQADGDTLEAALVAGNTVNTSLNPSTGNFTGSVLPGIQYVTDIAVRNNNGVSELFVAAADGYQGGATSPFTYITGEEYGLYKSADGGTTWGEILLPATAGGNKPCPNDLEIGADNKLWVATKNSIINNEGGGLIYSSNNPDATNYDLKYTVANANRVEIAVSSTDANRVYVLAQGTDAAAPVIMRKTGDAFTTTQNMGLPNDVDGGIPANDFTRNQAFYDLEIEVDPTNDNIVYTGGIDLFKSTNGGITWSQISHWYGLNGIDYVHADQQAIVINPTGNKLLFGSDGGVFYSSDGGTTISERNKDYNITQFYSVGVAPSSTGENFAAGAQDNATRNFFNATAGINGSSVAQGGDGGATDYDQDTGNYFISNYVYNTNIHQRNLDGSDKRTLDNDANSATNGDFINQQDLDSNLNILYTNYTDNSTSPPTYRIRRYTIPNPPATFFVTRVNLTDALLTGSPTALKVSPFTTTSTKLYVGTLFGDLLKVENANTTNPTWSDIGTPSFVGSISDVEFGANENEIFVTMHNYGVISIWYTNDGGATWANKEGNLPDLPVKCILQNPLNTEQVIIGTELGIWYTGNFSAASPSWASAFNGMSNVKVTDLDMRDDNKVFAATYGRGIFSGFFTPDVLSVQDNEFESLTMYPNPTDGVVNIKSTNNLSKAKVSVYDITGKLIKTLNNTPVTPNQVRVDLGTLATGSYFVTIEDGTYKSTKQIVKK